MKEVRLIAVFILLITIFTYAQSGNSQKPGSTGGQNNIDTRVILPVPQLVMIPRVVAEQVKDPIRLRDLTVDIEIVGNVALTTYDMSFHNPNSAVLEGEFIMPLGENQNVSAIALDINGKMRNGVVVEKQKARQTFEAIVRREVDPALVEKTAGNQFKMRIYPFDRNGTRRISVTIEEPLKTTGNSYVYALPLLFNQRMNFTIKAEVSFERSSETPTTDADLSAFSFTRAGNVFRASFSENNYLLNNIIAFTLPKQKGESVFTHKEGVETFFYADVNVKAAAKEKPAPQKIAVLWDSSLSASKRDIKRELSLLGAYFNRFPNIDVSFTTFNIKTDINKNFNVRGGNWDDLKKEIEAVVYDGATRFDKLNPNSLKADEILLFSDGISTLGNTRMEKSGIPVFAINSSPEFERGALMAAAKHSGGAFINLTGVSDEKALAMLTRQNLRLLGYSFDRKRFKEIYPEEGVEVSENFTFAGILASSDAEITLSFGYGKGDITETKRVTIKSGGDNPAVSRLWAQQKIRELELDSEKNEEEILKLGTEYSVVTEFTSLLVLEELRDYLAYKITPPPELLFEYNSAVSDMKEEEEEEKKSALEDAIELAEEIKKWWEKDFDQRKPPKEFEKLKDAISIDSTEVELGANPYISEASTDQVREVRSPVDAEMGRGSGQSQQIQRSTISLESAVSTITMEPGAQKEISGSSLMDMLNIMGGVAAPAAPGSSSANQTFAGVAATQVNIARDGISVYETGISAGSITETANISVKAWDPQTPYMKILKKSQDGELYKDYLKIKDGYEDQPSFYFDVTDEFISRGQKDRAVVVLSNIAEMKLDSIELLLTAANKLMELGEYQYAVDVFEKILKLRGEYPQSYRNLALAYQATGENQKALEMFYRVLTGTWERFEDIKQVVLVEMNNLISLNPKLKLSGINKKLIFVMPVDIRIVLGWNTDNTDIDIHVRDPYGEEADYSNVLTRIGGRVSEDILDGFGPEEFMLKKAVEGDYEIWTDYYGDSRQNISGPTTLYLDIYTFYGTKNQTHKRILVRTETVKENNTIGTVNFKKK